jgi:large subunit ribosomal protein L33
MAKSARELVILECTEARKLGVPPSRYFTTKNKKKANEKAGGNAKLEVMKYNPFLRRHTLHKEVKK